MSKELGRIVKDMVVYLLRHHGYTVRRNFDKKEYKKISKNYEYLKSLVLKSGV